MWRANRLAHVTLSTGHVADTPFGGRDLTGLEPIRDLLTAALRGERADLPDRGAGYRLNARSTPPRLAALVTGPHGPRVRGERLQ